MSLTCLCSAHGSPGVTVAALALAATWPERRPAQLVEADPFGGVISSRYHLADTPGLATLAVAARNALDERAISASTQVLPGGLSVVVGPVSAEETQAVLSDIAGSLGNWASGPTGVDVLVDCGRVWPGSPVLELVARADLNLVVTRATADQLRPAAQRAEAFRAMGSPVALLLVGDRPYRPDEVEASFGLPVGGVVDWDPRAAAALTEGGSTRGLRFSLLVRSATALARVLAERLPTAPDEEQPAAGTEPAMPRSKGTGT